MHYVKINFAIAIHIDALHHIDKGMLLCRAGVGEESDLRQKLMQLIGADVPALVCTVPGM